jgi:membrane-associated phospholipid phosphatase
MNFPIRFPRKFSTRLMLMLVFVLIALVVLWLIIHEVIIEKEQDIDTAIIAALSKYTSPEWTRFMELMTFLASSYFLIAGYIILISWFLFHQKKKIVALNVAITGTVGFLLVSILKNAFHRDRRLTPLIEKLNDYSFPSGHTTSGFIFYGLLIYLVWQSPMATPYKIILSVLLLLMSLLIGASRIYLGMHYPSDVAAGFCLGFLWLTVSLLFLHNLNKKTTPPVPR